MDLYSNEYYYEIPFNNMKNNPRVKKTKIINTNTQIMPWYVKEYFQAKLVIPYSYKTLYEYLKECRRFFEWLISDHEKLGETVRYADYDTIADVHIDDLAHLPKSVIEAYFVYLRENIERRSISEVSIIRTKDALSSFFKYLTQKTEDDEGEPYFYRNVMVKVKFKIKIKKPKDTLASHDDNMKEKLFLNDTQSFLDYIDNEHEKKISKRAQVSFVKNKERDLAVIALLLSTGVRLSELVNLNMEDVNLATRTITVIRKGRKKDVVNIAPFGIPYIERYLEIRKGRYVASDSDKAFFLTTQNKVPERLSTRSVELLVKKLSTAYGKPTTPHKLRHTLATRLYGQTKDSLLVSQQLGHRGTAMIEIYAHVAAETTKETLFSNAYIH